MSSLILLSIPLLVVYVLWDRFNSILRIASEQIDMYLPIINKVCVWEYGTYLGLGYAEKHLPW